jgi:hypothetical protein
LRQRSTSLRRQRIDRKHVLAVDRVCLDAEGLGPGRDRAGGDLGGLGVFGIAVVLAGIDDRQVPQRGHVHDLVHQALRGGAVAEEADGDVILAQQFGGKRRPGRDPHGAADDGVGAQIAVALVGDVHRPALAPAIAFLLAQQARRTSP